MAQKESISELEWIFEMESRQRKNLIDGQLANYVHHWICTIFL